MQDGHDQKETPTLYPCGGPLLSFSRPLRLIILGATGSIGSQTLDLVRRHPGQLEVVGLSCRSRSDEMAGIVADLVRDFPDLPPPLVAVTDPQAHAAAAGIPSWPPS